IDRWPDTPAYQQVWAVFQKMQNVSALEIGTQIDDRKVPFLRFSPDAQSLFNTWLTSLEQKIRSGDDHPAIESHLSKYRSLVPRLALLIHLADDGIGPVSSIATQKAIDWTPYLESHARRIYAIVANSATTAAKSILKRIAKDQLKDGFTLRDVYRNQWAGL